MIIIGVSMLFMNHIYVLVSDCTRVCQNGGTLDANCTCNCTDGYSGPNCESEYVAWWFNLVNNLVNYRYVVVTYSTLRHQNC